MREGKDNEAGGKIVLKLVTNDSGYFAGSLPPGMYCIVQEEQLKSLDIEQIVGDKGKILPGDQSQRRRGLGADLHVLRFQEIHKHL